MSATPQKFFTHFFDGRNTESRTAALCGTRSEHLVEQLMIMQGWRILARNFRRPGCELDIVAMKGKSLVVVEVKARKSLPDRCEDLLPHKKRLALVRGTKIFLGLMRRNFRGLDPKSVRIDLAILEKTKPPRLRWFVDVVPL